MMDLTTDEDLDAEREDDLGDDCFGAERFSACRFLSRTKRGLCLWMSPLTMDLRMLMVEFCFWAC